MSHRTSYPRDMFRATLDPQCVVMRTVQPARNLHKPSDPGGQNYPRAVKHRGRTPVDPGGHDPHVSR